MAESSVFIGSLDMRLILLSGSVALVIVLTACGGGGAGASSYSTPPTIDSPALSPFDPLVLSVEAPSYAADADEHKAFYAVNRERARCGFGQLAQNTRLDQAARAHREYLDLNSTWSHWEAPGTPGFTGFDAVARARAVGYESSSVSEGISAGDSGDAAVSVLLGAPYHAINLLSGWKEIGLSFANRTLVAVYAHLGRPQGSSSILTFPCAGTQGVRALNSQESPAPFDDYYETWGQPILVSAPTPFGLLSAEVRGPEGLVKTKVIYGKGHAVDPHTTCLGRWTCVIPAVLQPLTTYQVTLSWAQDGQTGGRTFTFQTGSR